MDPAKAPSSDSDSDRVKGEGSEPDQGKSTLGEEKMTARPVTVTEADTDGHKTEPTETAAIVVIPNQGGSSQSSVVAVVSHKPSTNGGAGPANNGDGDPPREPTIEIDTCVRKKLPPAEVLQKQAYLARAKCIVTFEICLQLAVLVSGGVGFFFYDDQFVAENYRAIIGLFTVALISLVLELRLYCGIKPQYETTEYLLHPRWSSCCLMWFIIARVLVYILLSVFLATYWLGISTCILALLVSIPELCIMGKVLSLELLEYQRLKTVRRVSQVGE